MKILVQFWLTVLDELGTLCRVSTVNDAKYITHRFEQEGEAFMTITLPDFGKDFEKSLAESQVSPSHFVGFRRRGKTPSFLGGFFDLLFDRDTGLLLQENESNFDSLIEAIFAVRQLTLMFGKMEHPCTVDRQEKALDQYLEVEQVVRKFERSITNEDREAFRWISKQLFGTVNYHLNEDIRNFSLMPKHGPGSTADYLLGNEKYDQTEWTTRLESVFPYGTYALPNVGVEYQHLQDQCRYLEPGEERPVRVVLVPKSQKTPRIIAIEPTCMQYMQQAISRRLVDYLESEPMISSMIGFEHQEPNQLLAKSGSELEHLATLDLSEASDRVSYLLVEEMFETFTDLMDGISATRSLKADVPGRGIITLRKYASMGSALCFPIEAMVFLTCVFHGICKSLNKPMSWKVINAFQDSVRVYGDDIIVPVEFTASVIDSLETFGFKVNQSKSFWTGKFRESCGAEFYSGEDVSITRVRRSFPQSRTDVREILSTVSLRNQCYAAGLWKSAKWLDERMDQVLPEFPSISPTSSLVGRHSIFYDHEVTGMSGDWQVPVVRGLSVSSQIPESPISGEGALLKFFLNDGLEPIVNEDHLQRQGRPVAVRLKRRYGRQA